MIEPETQDQLFFKKHGKRRSKVITFVLLFFCLSSFYFFRPIGVSQDILKLIYYSLLFILIGHSITFILGGYRDSFTSFIRVITILVFLSIGCAGLFWGQDFLDTFISSIPYFAFLFYFYLISLKLDLKKLEKIVWIFLVIYLICFYIAIMVAPFRLFTGYGEIDKMIDTSRGLPRIRLTLIGAGPLYLGYFMSIAKFKLTKRKIWIIICLFLFFTIVIHLGRQAILFSLILGLLFLLENIKFYKKIFITLVMGVLGYVFITSTPVISELLEKSENQLESQQNGEENPRLGAYSFYFFEVSPNLITTLFGNGQYSLGKSKFGSFIDKNGRKNGFIPADVGYANIFLIFGLLGLFVFSKLLFRIHKVKILSEHSYAKYYIYFLFLGTIAGNAILGSISMLCIALYIINGSNQIFRVEKNNLLQQD